MRILPNPNDDGDWEAWGRSRCLLFDGPMWHKRYPAREETEA